MCLHQRHVGQAPIVEGAAGKVAKHLQEFAEATAEFFATSDRSCTKQSGSTEPLSVEALCVWTCCIENTCTLNRRSSFLLFSKCSLRLLRSVLPRSLRFIAALCIATNLNITGLRDCVLLLFPVRHSENAPKFDVTPNTPAAFQSRGPTASSGATPRAVTG